MEDIEVIQGAERQGWFLTRSEKFEVPKVPEVPGSSVIYKVC